MFVLFSRTCKLCRCITNPLFDEDGASQIFHFEMLKYLHKNIEEDFISGLH